MGYNRLTKGTALVGALSIDTQDLTVGDDATITGDAIVGTLTVGGGTKVTKVVKGTASVDLPSINNLATGSATFTVTGAAVGDVVVVNPPTMTAGLSFGGAAVTGTDTVTVYAQNASGVTINEAAANYTYILFKF